MGGRGWRWQLAAGGPTFIIFDQKRKFNGISKEILVARLRLSGIPTAAKKRVGSLMSNRHARRQAIHTSLEM